MANVCFINTTRFWGGGEKWHHASATYLSSRGHRVFLVANPTGELHQRLLHANVIRFPMKLTNPSFLNPNKIKKLVSFFRSNQIQIVVFNGSREVKIGALSASIAGVPAIVYRRGIASPIKDTLFNRFLYKQLITHFLTNSEATAQAMFSKIGFPPDENKVKVIYNGIDHQRMTAINRTPCKDAGEPIIIGSAGRLDKQKGQAYLVQMAGILREMNFPFRMCIAGEGPFRPKLEQLIAECSLQNHVELVGFVSDIRSFLERLDIFVFPSLSEGFGYAIAEAMAAGLPIVALDTGSIPEVVAPDQTGYLIPPKDIHALTEKTLLLSQKPELRRKMGENGRLRVQSHFDEKRQLSKIESYLCHEVLEA